MKRLEKKWETIKTLVPGALIAMNGSRMGVLYYGTTVLPMSEALDLLAGDGIILDQCHVRAFPFGEEV